MNSTQTIILIVIIVALLGFRIYRSTREQRWHIQQMWILPAIFLVITLGYVALDTAQYGLASVAGVIGLLAGFAVGMYQGNHTTLRIDKASSVAFIKVRPLGTLIFIGILALRIGLRMSMMSGMTQAQLQSGALPPVSPLEAMLGSGLLALAAGTIIGLRWYVKTRYDAAPA